MSVKAKTKKKLELVFCLFFFFKQFVFIIFSKILGSQQIADFKKGKKSLYFITDNFRSTT